VLKTLTNLGLTQLEAKVYLYLSKRGPQKAGDTAKALKLVKQQLYPTLKRLQRKGIVTSTLEHPARFSVLSFDKVLDLFVKAKMDEVQLVQRNKDELISDWQNISIGEKSDTTPRFAVIEGRNYVYSKIQQMIKETKDQLAIIATVPDLARADQFGVFDTALNHPLKSNIRFRFLTELYEQNVTLMKRLLERKPNTIFNFEGRTPDLGLKLANRMIIKDEDEALFFINITKDVQGIEQEDLCLWTNSKTLVQAFTTVFENLWHNSTGIEKKIIEIETGKPTPKTYVISDAETAKKKYLETLKSAKDEIVMITSSESLFELRKNFELLNGCIKRGAAIKIMAPITVKNLQATQQLSGCCDVRHLPASYLRTTLIDGLHLFQFKTPSDQENIENLQPFENAFYTTDAEYVAKTKTMLHELWKSAHVLSGVTLGAIINPPAHSVAPFQDAKRYGSYRKTIGYVNDPKLGSITEQEILEKIAKIHRTSPQNPLEDTTFMCGNGAQALISPPKHFDLPDMVLTVFHCNERSTYGMENWLIVQAWLETPRGYTFVPVTIVGDNPQATNWRKNIHAGTPLGQNLPLVKKDELQVRAQGNILFAGWTVPIPLYPLTKSLPPACIFFEGRGELRTGVVKTMASLTRMQKSEFNGFEAFVTFFHPSSKYSGPGTDGLLFRDIVITSYPKHVEP
jgi:sugar-specific transcriptional regulator TrmB